MKMKEPSRGPISRRQALRSATAAVGGMHLPLLGAPGPGTASPMPEIRLGDKKVSRLIAGGNPVWGYSHATPRLSRHMVDYFTQERVIEFLLRCEQQGINTWQSSYNAKLRAALLAAREKGCRIQFICLTGERDDAVFPDILSLRPLALVHHGEYTDAYFRQGQQEKIHDFVKKTKDAGLLAGVSTHSPDNLMRVEDSGWENDFYMGCFYNIRRFTADDLRQRLGDELLDELYLRNDPQEMTARMRRVKKPCLGFKILAAGRRCNTDASVEEAFAFAYKNIKPTDGLVVGMYPVFFDEVRIDAGLARKYGAA